MTDLKEAPRRTATRAPGRGAHRSRTWRIKLSTLIAVVVALLAGVSYAGARPSRPVTTTSPLNSGEVALWNAEVVPRLPADADTKAVELGTRFSTATAGTVGAILFYKHVQNTGQHVGSLWDSSGRRLASVQFSRETASGWQVARLATPVPLTAGRTYVVSYNAPTGRYADDTNYFGRDRIRTVGPLTATAGVFSYGTQVRMPGQIWAGSNYYVDVAFTPDSTASASSPSTSTSPLPPPPSASAIVPPSASASAPASATATAPSSSATASSGAGAGRGCAAAPSSCGYPDASTTGVPSSVSLRSVPAQVSKGAGWHWDNRGWLEVDGDGAVLDGLEVHANVNVTASSVTLKNMKIVVGGETFGVSLRHTSNVVIQDTDITSPDAGSGRLMVGVKDVYGDASDTTIRRTDISHTSNGVQIYAGLVEDNYIHDVGFKSGDHTNGTTDNGGSSRQLTLRHNTVFNKLSQTDAISLFQDFGNQTNRVIDNNLVAGGGYTIYGGANPGGAQTSNIRITNNRFSRIYYPNSGYFGYATAFDRNGPGNVWSGNIWDDSGAGVPAP